MERDVSQLTFQLVDLTLRRATAQQDSSRQITALFRCAPGHKGGPPASAMPCDACVMHVRFASGAALHCACSSPAQLGHPPALQQPRAKQRQR